MGQTMCGVVNEGSPKAISNMEQIRDLDFNRNSTYQLLEQYALTVCKECDISPVYNNLIQRLLSKSQFHLLIKLKEMHSNTQKNHFLSQLSTITDEMDIIDSLYHHFLAQVQHEQAMSVEDMPNTDRIEHIQNVIRVQDINYDDYSRQYMTGLGLIAQKQVALVVLAGGKQARFGKESKGVCNLNLPSEQSLFEIIGRKLKTLKDIAFQVDDKPQSQQQASFQVVIITNNQNFFSIKKIWKDNNNFGLQQEDVVFIAQSMYPITDMNGKLVLKDDSNVHMFPCGTGDAILKLYQHRIIKKLLEQGYSYVHFIGIDNLLVKPLDPLLLGIAHEKRKAITQKCCSPIDREETDFFRILQVNDRASIVETSEIDRMISQKKVLKSKRRMECTPGFDVPLPTDLYDAPIFMTNALMRLDFLDWFHQQADLKYAFESKFRVMKRYLSDVLPIPNSTPVFNSDLSEQQSQLQQLKQPTQYPSLFSKQPISLPPTHISQTDTTFFTQDKNHNDTQIAQEPNVLIFEKNIGDLLKQTDDVCFVKVNSDEEFAPIIYKTGRNSPEDALIKLSNLHKRWLQLPPSDFLNSDLVEVCSQVSYAGENLDQSVEYFKNYPSNLVFPLYLNVKRNQDIKAYMESNPVQQAQQMKKTRPTIETEGQYTLFYNKHRRNSDLVSKSFSYMQTRNSKLFFSQEELPYYFQTQQSPPHHNLSQNDMVIKGNTERPFEPTSSINKIQGTDGRTKPTNNYKII